MCRGSVTPSLSCTLSCLSTRGQELVVDRNDENWFLIRTYCFTGSDCSHVLYQPRPNQKANLPVLKERRSKKAEVDLHSVFKNAVRMNSQLLLSKMEGGKPSIKTSLCEHSPVPHGASTCDYYCRNIDNKVWTSRNTYLERQFIQSV